MLLLKSAPSKFRGAQEKRPDTYKGTTRAFFRSATKKFASDGFSIGGGRPGNQLVAQDQSPPKLQ